MSGGRNLQKNMDSFYYSLEDPLPEDHPQYRYFKLYEKYTSEASNAFSFQEGPECRQPPLAFPPFEPRKGRERVELLEEENVCLRKEVGEQRELIQRLKYELFYCNTQLEQITKIESVEYPKAVEELRQEIEQILEKTKSVEETKVWSNQRPSPAQYHLSRADKLSNKPFRLSSTGFDCKLKQNAQQLSIGPSSKQEDEKSRQFVEGLKDMYAKIMGGSARSLKQLWKWLKEIAQMASKMKKWSRRYREFSKSTLHVQSQSLVKFLHEAVIIAN